VHGTAEGFSCSSNTQRDYLRGVLAWSTGYGSYLAVLITLAGLTILVWWALPSVVTEKFLPGFRMTRLRGTFAVAR
jgi:hypothetical protein